MDRDEAVEEVKGNVGDLFEGRVMEAGKGAFSHFALTAFLWKMRLLLQHLNSIISTL